MQEGQWGTKGVLSHVHMVPYVPRMPLRYSPTHVMQQKYLRLKQSFKHQDKHAVQRNLCNSPDHPRGADPHPRGADPSKSCLPRFLWTFLGHFWDTLVAPENFISGCLSVLFTALFGTCIIFTYRTQFGSLGCTSRDTLLSLQRGGLKGYRGLHTPSGILSLPTLQFQCKTFWH